MRITMLRVVDGVEEAHALCGVYDLLIKIKGNSVDKLEEITKLRIKPIVEVNSSLTLMVVQDNYFFVVSFCDNIILYYFKR
jgi:DNA-binding Lrp family transcriptional regulator